MRLRRGAGPPLCIGHRGAAALAPANTLAALEAALEAGVDMVEVDVFALQGRLVLSHSSRELHSEPLTLEDALAFLTTHAPVGVLTDVKTRGCERELVDALRAHDLVDRALVSTTDLAVLRAVKRLEPRLARSVTYPRNRGRAAALARAPRALPWRIGALLARAAASAATLNHRIVTRAVVERCHGLDAAVFAWTVNEPALVKRLDALGVDGVITDYPANCRATLPA
ncbi:MAG: glycerophosphodiester phosphodiesterase [Gaiellaceae bacterium]